MWKRYTFNASIAQCNARASIFRNTVGFIRIVSWVFAKKGGSDVQAIRTAPVC